MSKKLLLASAVSIALLSGCLGSSSNDDDSEDGSTSVTHSLTNLKKVLKTNADIALATYDDSVDTAKTLKTALKTFTDAPTAATLEAAKKAWLVSREPYGQSEVYRFRDTPIDDSDGPEGAINAWPLGEALIDYVNTAANTDFTSSQVGVDASDTGVNGNAAIDGTDKAVNIIASAVTINSSLLGKTEEGADNAVIAGYHAIEFMLWGQDLDSLNATPNAPTSRIQGSGANFTATGNGGHRPASDFIITAGNCTSGNATEAATTKCERRVLFVTVAVDKLIADLEGVRDEWKTGGASTTYADTFIAPADLTTAKNSLLEILTGMGTMSRGELAGERMQIALASNSQEDEHSCFSDNTHRDVWLDAEGVANSYKGKYAGYDSTLDGTDDNTTRAVDGYGIDDYLADLSGQTTIKDAITALLATTETQYKLIDANARNNITFDIAIQDKTGATATPIKDTILALDAQAKKLADLATALGLDGTKVNPSDGTACDTTDPTKAC